MLGSLNAALKAAKPGILGRLFSGSKADKEQVDNITEQIISCTSELSGISKREKELRGELSNAEKCEKIVSDFEASCSAGNILDLSLPYDKLQQSNFWFDEEYRMAQSELFICALNVRKQFLYENVKSLDSALEIRINAWKYASKDRALIKLAWQWINFAIPVIGTTFASLGRMLEHLDEGSIGHLFIDEAGQAVPQAGVGAIYRAKHVMVVGDPSQIKPVLPVDQHVLPLLLESFGVTEDYISENASVQTLVDRAGKYGFYRGSDQEEKIDSSWIGIPLWVHRRCQPPMFDISNAISYEGNMVEGKPGVGKAEFFDVKGEAVDKYVKEQGEFLKAKLLERQKDDPGIFDRIYVITPFKNVSDKLISLLDKIGFTKREEEEKKVINIGTVHTFQGKEADIVFLVLGADEKSKGAANWAVSEPNIINVAATRAKNEFYIIGDRSLYESLKSGIMNTTLSIIDGHSARQG